MATSMVLQVPPFSQTRETDSDAGARVVAMRDSALFSGLTEQECKMLALSATRRRFASGQPLFMQGKRIREVLLIESGTVKMSKIGCDGDEVILWINGRSDVLEIPLDDQKSRYTCTARAVESCSILRWNARLLHGVMQEYPQIRANVNNIMSEKLTELEQRFRELTTESIANRLARTVHRLICSIGREHSQGVLLSVTREELAKISGMSMFTTSRVISAWSDEGFILPLRKAIVVRDPYQFAAICRETREGGSLPGYEETEECSSYPN
jgi:CRP-like cAMP-binding protein